MCIVVLPQFVYLGQATFYQDRMNEFLNAAKDFEITELCKTSDQEDTQNMHEDLQDKTNNSIETYVSESNNLHTNSVVSENDFKNDACAEVKVSNPSIFNSVQCPECLQVFSGVSNMRKHHQTKHVGIKFSCKECDYQATQKANLDRHKRQKHAIMNNVLN